MPAQNRLRIASFNARGLRDFANLMALSREMKRRNIDVLLLQEHNIKSEAVARTTAQLQRVEIFSAWSCSLSPDERGGAAIWIRQGEASVSSVLCDHRSGCNLEGGLCIVEASIGVGSVRLASVYVPSKIPDRKSFITVLENHSLITPDTIIGGDMNCVATPELDMKALSGATETRQINKTSGEQSSRKH